MIYYIIFRRFHLKFFLFLHHLFLFNPFHFIWRKFHFIFHFWSLVFFYSIIFIFAKTIKKINSKFNVFCFCVSTRSHFLPYFSVSIFYLSISFFHTFFLLFSIFWNSIFHFTDSLRKALKRFHTVRNFFLICTKNVVEMLTERGKANCCFFNGILIIIIYFIQSVHKISKKVVIWILKMLK